MGVSIYWQPLRGEHIPVGPRSRFVDMITEAFGVYPWNISAGDAEKLHAMRIGAEDESIKAALTTLADAAMRHGHITVWPEY
jgi:hypothetical protein